MANALITSSIIAKEALMQLENNMVMGNNVHRTYKKEFVKVGDTVSIRKPVQFSTTKAVTRVNSDVTEKNANIRVQTQAHVSWNFTTADLTMSIEQYSERYIKPAMISLANTVDADLCALYKKLYFATGVAGTTPNAFLDIALMAQKMDEAAIPDDGNRKLVLNPAARWAMADGMKDVFNERRVKDSIDKGYLNTIANFEIFGDQNIVTHTKGVATGTPLVDGASQNVTYESRVNGENIWTQSLITNGWTNSTTDILLEGDLFTIVGVNSVNPISKADTGSLQQFTVREDADSGASTGPATLVISPPIITSGAYQTVTAAPANDAVIVVTASHAANLAFHKNALALVMCPLELPDGAAFKARESYNGMSVRVVKDYDITNDTDIIRLDILYGVEAIDPRLGGRLLG